jgi:hypothetical protein
MLNVNQLLRTGVNFMSDNAPAILTAFGAVGVVGTSVLTAKATFEAADRIREAEEKIANEPREPLTKAEKAKIVWPLYIPAVTSGTVSVAAIVMSHRISSKRAAVLAAAYALNQDKLEEYQEKVKEKFGQAKEKETRDELAQDRINRELEHSEVYFSPTDNKVLIREDYTGRFFWSSIEAVNKAVNEINHHVLTEGSARISDFYDCLGLSHVSTSDYFGWTMDDRLEIDWSTCTTPDGAMAVHSFEYVNHPVMNPEREARSFR